MCIDGCCICNCNCISVASFCSLHAQCVHKINLQQNTRLRSHLLNETSSSMTSSAKGVGRAEHEESERVAGERESWRVEELETVVGWEIAKPKI